MANYDLVCFLEYYLDRASVYDPVTNKRAPSYQWQNFYQEPQDLSAVDSDVQGDFFFIPFNLSGFALKAAESIDALSVEIAATGEIIDLTDNAINANRLVIASMYLQDPGQNQIDSASAALVSRYIGTVDAASVSDTSVSWSVTPLIDNTKPQVPTRKIASDLVGVFVGR